MAVLLASEQAHSGAGHGEGAPCEARLACEPTLSLQECRYDFPRKEMTKKSTYLLKYWIKMKKKKKKSNMLQCGIWLFVPRPHQSPPAPRAHLTVTPLLQPGPAYPA